MEEISDALSNVGETEQDGGLITPQITGDAEFEEKKLKKAKAKYIFGSNPLIFASDDDDITIRYKKKDESHKLFFQECDHSRFHYTLDRLPSSIEDKRKESLLVKINKSPIFTQETLEYKELYSIISRNGKDYTMSYITKAEFDKQIKPEASSKSRWDMIKDIYASNKTYLKSLTPQITDIDIDTIGDNDFENQSKIIEDYYKYFNDKNYASLTCTTDKIREGDYEELKKLIDPESIIEPFTQSQNLYLSLNEMTLEPDGYYKYKPPTSKDDEIKQKLENLYNLVQRKAEEIYDPTSESKAYIELHRLNHFIYQLKEGNRFKYGKIDKEFSSYHDKIVEQLNEYKDNFEKAFRSESYNEIKREFNKLNQALQHKQKLFRFPQLKHFSNCDSFATEAKDAEIKAQFSTKPNDAAIKAQKEICEELDSAKRKLENERVKLKSKSDQDSKKKIEEYDKIIAIIDEIKKDVNELNKENTTKHNNLAPIIKKIEAFKKNYQDGKYPFFKKIIRGSTSDNTNGDDERNNCLSAYNAIILISTEDKQKILASPIHQTLSIIDKKIPKKTSCFSCCSPLLNSISYVGSRLHSQKTSTDQNITIKEAFKRINNINASQLRKDLGDQIDNLHPLFKAYVEISSITDAIGCHPWNTNRNPYKKKIKKKLQEILKDENYNIKAESKSDLEQKLKKISECQELIEKEQEYHDTKESPHDIRNKYREANNSLDLLKQELIENAKSHEESSIYKTLSASRKKSSYKVGPGLFTFCKDSSTNSSQLIINYDKLEQSDHNIFYYCLGEKGGYTHYIRIGVSKGGEETIYKQGSKQTTKKFQKGQIIMDESTIVRVKTGQEHVNFETINSKTDPEIQKEFKKLNMSIMTAKEGKLKEAAIISRSEQIILQDNSSSLIKAPSTSPSISRSASITAASPAVESARVA